MNGHPVLLISILKLNDADRTRLIGYLTLFLGLFPLKKQLPGVEDILRIKAGFNRLHHINAFAQFLP